MHVCTYAYYTNILHNYITPGFRFAYDTKQLIKNNLDIKFKTKGWILQSRIDLFEAKYGKVLNWIK